MNSTAAQFVSRRFLTLDVWTSTLSDMRETVERYAPGQIRDAIVSVLSFSSHSMQVKEIEAQVSKLIGSTSGSSIRSYLRLNAPGLFVREERGFYSLQRGNRASSASSARKLNWLDRVHFGNSTLFHDDCFAWLERQAANSIHAVVTDPPYGLHEYTPEQQEKLRNGKGGVWRIPPSFDGHARAPLPRFTTLTREQLQQIRDFFYLLAKSLIEKLVPGAQVVVASNPLVSFLVSSALAAGGLERRGEIIRLTMTMRGGDRPKAAHDDFPNISVMPRSMWEPWLVFRKPVEGRVQDNLRRWGTGGFRRPSKDKPFGDVIQSSPTRKEERALAPHPSLKPQAFLRQIVRAVLPLAKGVILDPFAGSGSTLAAAEAVGYQSIGIEKDEFFFSMACEAIPRLIEYPIRPSSRKAGTPSSDGVS